MELFLASRALYLMHLDLEVYRFQTYIEFSPVYYYVLPTSTP